MKRGLRPTAMEWVCLVAGLYLTIHYSWLMDDAFVYFRYVDNLLHLNLGLVYNQGEYVEGFSSPLWTLLLIVGRAAGANYWLLTRLLGVLSFGAFWTLTLLAHRRLSPRPSVNLPLVLLTFNYAVLSSFTSGLETPLVQVAAAAFAWNAVAPRSRLGQILVGASPLLRHELLLPWIVSVAWGRKRNGRWPWWSIAVAAGTLSAWTLFRIAYYADLLPNTFHLKNMVWVAQGLGYVWDSLWTYGHWLYLPFAAGAILWLARRRRPLPELPARGVMALMALLVVAYVVKIGGDFLHYRYLAFSLPLLVLATAGVADALVMARRRWLALVVGIVAAVVTSALYPRGLDRHPYTLRARTEGDGVVEDAMAHRLRPELRRQPWESGAAYDPRAAYSAAPRPYRFERLIADYWCVRNYEHFDWYVVHSLGLTDPVLARIDVPNQRPGHRWQLHPLGQQLVELRAKYGFEPGFYRRVIRGGEAPDWVEANRRTLRLIERRATNSHDFFENLRLAFRRAGRIELVSDPPEVPTIRGKRLGRE